MLSGDDPGLIQARQRFSDLDHVPLGLAVLDSALRVLFWNTTMEEWTGLGRDQLLGRPLADFHGEWALPHYRERLSHLFAGGPPVVFSPLLHPRMVPGRPGEARSYHVKAAAVPDGQGAWWAFLSVEDVTVLTRRLEELRELKVRQDRMMREIHHRVKNNLNMISGLISLQRARSPEGPGAFDDLQGRIAAIAEIHDVLYHSSDLGIGHTAGYLEPLARLLDQNLSQAGDHELVLDLDPSIALKTDNTVLLGLIQTELMTNALKYGLTGRPGHRIKLSLRRLEGRQVEYALEHSGDRLPDTFDPATSPGLGMLLLTAYADQLGTRLGWSKGDPTRFWLRFTE